VVFPSCFSEILELQGFFGHSPALPPAWAGLHVKAGQDE